MMDPLIFSDTGQIFHFYHANGYPPQAYQRLLDPLRPHFQVVASYLRPFWPQSAPASAPNWTVYRDDFLELLSGADSIFRNQPLVAAGHSIGATVSLLAAFKHPDLFQALILLDPVIFPPLQGFWLQASTRLGFRTRHRMLISRTIQRKTHFCSQKEMYQNYRRKAVFRRIPDDVLLAYVQGLGDTQPDGSIILRYPPSWEVQIYRTSGLADYLIWTNRTKLQIPVLIIRGEESKTFTSRTASLLKNRLPKADLFSLPEAGHLVPLEVPDQVSDLMLDFLQA